MTELVARQRRPLSRHLRPRASIRASTRDHWVEVELGDDVPPRPAVWLVAARLDPPDRQLDQRRARAGPARRRRRGSSWRSRRPTGGWNVARADLGFPAGKNKTILIDLTASFRPGAPRRLRLRTNLEIYWDCARGRRGRAPSDACRLDGSPRRRPSCGYRGYLADDAGRRELARVAATTIRLVGTGPALARPDRLLHALRRRPRAAGRGRRPLRHRERRRRDGPPLRRARRRRRPDWVRDFVLIGDGWNKDGDYNTAFSQDRPAPPVARRGRATTRPPARWRTTPSIAASGRLAGVSYTLCHAARFPGRAEAAVGCEALANSESSP